MMPDIEQIGSLCAYIPLGILALLLLAQLYYILFVYGKLARFRVASLRGPDRQPPLSVIICARNEEKNLKAFLPVVLEQDYPDFEVIVVNDCSQDSTFQVLNGFVPVYGDRLKIIDIGEQVRLKHVKKFALTLGIKAARFGHLVFTDADCRPASPNWLAEMAGAFAEGTEIVLGYSPYFKGKGLLNRLIRFETAHTAMSYLSYALRKNAYMGVGRNLAYTKSLFSKGKGFARHMHITSGDDDLFVNQNAAQTNVAVAIHPDAHVHSEPKTTWKSYYGQKGRHAGASVLYKGRHKRMLAAQLLSALLFYACLPVCLLLFPELWCVPLGAYLLRLGCQMLVFWPIYKKLRVKDLLLWLPLLDPCYYFYICANGLFHRRKKRNAW